MTPVNPREQLIGLGAEKLADALLDLSTRSDQARKLVELLLSSPEDSLRYFKAKLQRLFVEAGFFAAEHLCYAII